MTTKKRKISKKKNHLKKEVLSFLDEFEPDHEGFTTEELDEKQERLKEKVELEHKQKKIIREQLGSNKGAIEEQLGSNKALNKGAIREQLGSNKGTIFSGRAANKGADKGADKGAIREQLGSKKKSILTLTGKENLLMRIIFKCCQNNGSLETPIVTTESLKKTLNVSSTRVGNLVKRLQKKGLVKVIFSQRGNGGFRKFKLSTEDYKKIATWTFENNWGVIREQLGSNKGAHKGADKGASSPSSSSYIDIKETTTIQTDKKSQLGCIIIPESLAAIGINQNHLSQIQAKFPHAVSNLQRSLEALAYDIDHAGGIKNFKQQNRINGLIGWFFGAMKTGGGYESKNEGFLTDEEKGEIEALNRLRERQEKREQTKRELDELMFKEWEQSKTDSELNRIVAPTGKTRGKFHLEMLKAHFLKNEAANFKTSDLQGP